MKKAFGYLRVSGKGQIEGDGFDRQRDTIKAYATANGIQIVKWYEEEGVSGTIIDRPALQEMLVAIMSNGVHTFLIEKLDRLARDQMVQEHIVQDCQAKDIEIISVMEPDLCVDDPTRKLLRGVMGLISEYDKTMIVLKLKAARDRQRIKTGHCEGRKPFGARKGENAVITRVMALKSAGANYEAIAKTLNADGVKTRKKGGQWFPSGVRQIILKADAKA
jgi:DNA invertase Pin-like site-specific DNA recombinase